MKTWRFGGNAAMTFFGIGYLQYRLWQTSSLVLVVRRWRGLNGNLFLAEFRCLVEAMHISVQDN
jgi:hypothetical protein